jgi:hypothetical protein
MPTDPESIRLAEADTAAAPWRKWGPYLSERQWGTVREDYSATGEAWSYFSHDQARSRTYGWGEDGLAGLSDDQQKLCFALALWNGVDPILKERLFGLTNAEGNHGEDVKEYYFYLDNTPTHSYMKWLYKYPQRAYPYNDLVHTNAARNRHELEYELIDTGVFDEDRYFDVMVEYAKSAPEDLLVRISVVNRGPDDAVLHLLPTLWFRGGWQDHARPTLSQAPSSSGTTIVAAEHPELGRYWLAAEGTVPVYFTENETNTLRLWGQPNASPYVKDGIHELVVHGRTEAVNPARVGTKCAPHYQLRIAAGATAIVRLRLTAGVRASEPFGAAFDEIIHTRHAEADAFYAAITPATLSADERLVMRQALSGMLWSKQFYFFDLDSWLDAHGSHPLRTMWSGRSRNQSWFHMLNSDVISMPDKWEYPWFAAWDLAFHTIALSMVDVRFAKQQIGLMLHDLYMHPSGQIPAYEWNFGDVNPPVHAWATLLIYEAEKRRHGGSGDLAFLSRAFQGLSLNFAWWLNRKDPGGRNCFEGGFLGLDNIGVFDRSRPLPTGGYLEQADGTAWMVLFAQNMLSIALELARHDPVYEDAALRYLEHYFWIAAAMDRIGDCNDEMWDEGDGFYYDLLRLPNGDATRLKVRSMVGLLPLCAATVFEGEVLERFPRLGARAQRFLRYHSELVANIAAPDRPGVAGRRLLSVLSESKLRRVLARMLDEKEFLGTYGLRALSRFHLEHPYVFSVHGEEYRVAYEPAESGTGLFGGNSNWRGPIWMPVNVMVLRALLQMYTYYGDAFTIECPTGSGKQMNLFEVAQEISRRLASIFLRGSDGRRPVFGGVARFQTDPHWRDHIPFYEYFHGDNGAGIGASHQTGWTGVVAKLIQLFGTLRAEDVLAGGPEATHAG